jgi:hypothetical protein
VPIGQREVSCGIESVMLTGYRGSACSFDAIYRSRGDDSHRKHTGSADRAALEAAARFHQVMTSEQLRAAGLGRGSIAHRVRKGWLSRMFRGVYRVGPVDGAWSRGAAARLACGPAAVLGHESAAALWGIRPRARCGAVMTCG